MQSREWMEIFTPIEGIYMHTKRRSKKVPVTRISTFQEEEDTVYCRKPTRIFNRGAFLSKRDDSLTKGLPPDEFLADYSSVR
tara:strand:- start:174 stop:419 length:246 start_codon:yes stop_codon:yes gene_type:complete